MLLGTSQASDILIVQLASITGVYGLSVLVALVSTAAASARPSVRSTAGRSPASAWSW